MNEDSFLWWLAVFDQGGKFLSSSDVLVFSYDFQDIFPFIAVYLTDLDDRLHKRCAIAWKAAFF
jgi:hypothetical protein